MLFPRLRQLAKARGYQKDKESVYGLENGIPFAFGHTKNYQDKIARIYVGKMTDEQMEQVEAYLRENAAALGYHRYRVNEGEIMVYFTESWKATPLDTLMHFADTMRDYLTEMGIGKEPICFDCQKPCAANDTYLQGSILYFAHEKCMRKTGMAPSRKTRHEYVKPTVYTLCASFVAAAVMVLLMVITAHEAVVLGVAVAVAAVTVYHRSYGPRTWQGMAIIVLSVMFATMVMMIGYWVSEYMIVGETFRLSLISKLFTLQWFLDSLLFAEIAGLVGTFLTIMFRVWRESKEVAKPKKVQL